MSIGAAFVLGVSFFAGAVVIAEALSKIANRIGSMGRIMVNLQTDPIVKEFRKWVRVHYLSEYPND